MSTTSRKLPSIIQYKDEEIEEYADKVKQFRNEDIPEDKFMSFRLRLGVYGQRQPDSQMIRVKIPGGLLHSDQMDGLGDLIERYVPLNKGHITTRENIQVHHVKLEDATEVMRILQSVGLSTKEACGNSVRNVVACPMAGLDPQQAFDIQPYMGAFVRNFVRRDFTFHMPRKVKPAFSCGEHDCAVTPMHDLGFIARVRDEDGEIRKGFKITVGGGTSIQPLMAETLYEFVPVEEFLKVCEATLRVFNRTAWLRKNKMKARIKVLIHKEGMDSFRLQVEEELKEEWAKDYDSREDLLFFDDELAILVGYVVGSRILYRMTVQVADVGTSAEGRSLRWGWIMFVISAAAISGSAPFLASSAQSIAEVTGLGESFVGVVAVAFVTTLPELVATGTAIRRGADDLAVAGMFGTNAFNVGALAVADIFSPGESLFGSLDESHVAAGLFAILLMGIAAFQVRRRRRLPWFSVAGPSTTLMVGLYAVGLALVYRLA